MLQFQTAMSQTAEDLAKPALSRSPISHAAVQPQSLGTHLKLIACCAVHSMVLQIRRPVPGAALLLPVTATAMTTKLPLSSIGGAAGTIAKMAIKRTAVRYLMQRKTNATGLVLGRSATAAILFS